MAWEAANQGALPLVAVCLPHGGLLIQRFHGDLAEEDPQEPAGSHVRGLHSARLGRYGNSSHTHACAHTAIPCSGFRSLKATRLCNVHSNNLLKVIRYTSREHTQTRRLCMCGFECWSLKTVATCYVTLTMTPGCYFLPNQLLLNGLLSHTWYHVHRPTVKVTTSSNVRRLG